MTARLRKIGRRLRFVALVLSARLIGRLPIPEPHRGKLVRYLGVRALLLALLDGLNR